MIPRALLVPCEEFLLLRVRLRLANLPPCGLPRGQTRPYSWLAREARRPLAVRAAASAIAKNPLWLLVPCHRVIAANGTIGSYGPSGVARKRELLKREGVVL